MEWEDTPPPSPQNKHTHTNAHAHTHAETEILSCILVTIHKHFNVPFLFPLGW